MSSPWAVLPPGTWGLPSAALLVDEEDLALEPTDLPTLGFVPVDYALDHPGTLPTAEVLRVELGAAGVGTARLFKAAETQRSPVDTWGVLRPTRPTRPAAGWQAHGDLRPVNPDRFTVEGLREVVTLEERLLVVTGDLSTFWSRLNDTGLPAASKITAGGLTAWVVQGGADGPSTPAGWSSRAAAGRRGPLARLLSRPLAARPRALNAGRTRGVLPPERREA